MELAIGIIAGLAVGGIGALLVSRFVLARHVASARQEREELLAEAGRSADAIRREARVEVREEAVRLRADLDRELQERRREATETEQQAQLAARQAESRQAAVEQREQSLRGREATIEKVVEETSQVRERQVAELERISGLTIQEAKTQLLERTEEVIRQEMGRLVRQAEEEAQTEAKRRAQTLVGDAIQRVAASHASEMTVSLVELPSDEMKGWVIGREGRNIRALESLTGVEFIIDDTPQAVVLSSFDGVRREIAKLTLSKLIEDGRIHPARIEEMYYRSKSEIDDVIRQAGEQAVFEANCGKMHDELVKLLGRLHFRTSYGQNVLKHTLEVAHLGGAMAAELGVGRKTVKRAALLHDIGKAVTHEVEGSHAAISTEFARKYGESPQVVHAVQAHHYEVQPETVEAVLLIAADAVSASRPGARGESLEHYIKRLQELEQIAAEKNGVERVYAIQAGREVRVMVKPSELDDDGAALLSHEIARDIEKQLEYPGQIKVTVIRESRATEFAK